MSGRRALAIALSASLLASSAALAQTGGPSSAATSGGGRYRLTSVVWRLEGAASGGVYRLAAPGSPSGGNQCCCIYLPCALRSY